MYTWSSAGAPVNKMAEAPRLLLSPGRPSTAELERGWAGSGGLCVATPYMDGYISLSKLLILRSSVRAAMAVTCPLPPRMLFEKFSIGPGWLRSC